MVESSCAVYGWFDKLEIFHYDACTRKIHYRVKFPSTIQFSTTSPSIYSFPPPPSATPPNPPPPPPLSPFPPNPSISFFLFISVLQTQQTQQRLTQHLDPRGWGGHRRRASPSQRGQGRGRKWASRRGTQKQRQRQRSSITTVWPPSVTGSFLPRATGSGSGSGPSQHPLGLWWLIRTVAT